MNEQNKLLKLTVGESNHYYAKTEIDALFTEIEEAEACGRSINLFDLKHILRDGDLSLYGFFDDPYCPICFELHGLRWTIDGIKYKAIFVPITESLYSVEITDDVILSRGVCWFTDFVPEDRRIPIDSWLNTDEIDLSKHRCYDCYEEVIIQEGSE